RNAIDIPGLADELADLLQLLQSHGLIGLVYKMQRSLPFGVVSDHALENTDGTVFSTKQLAGNLLGIYRLARDDHHRVRIGGTPAYGRKHRDLITVVDTGIFIHVILVDRR